MTVLNGIKLKGHETFNELLEINKKKSSLICKAKKCDTVLKPDYLSRIDNAYCKDCLD
jgi:hypothetical protein